MIKGEKENIYNQNDETLAVTVGENAVVDAGAMVFKDLPAKIIYTIQSS